MVRWDLRICRALLLGCPSDLGNARGVLFFSVVFLLCFRTIWLSAKFGKWWKVFLLSLKIATIFSITYPFLLGNQFHNTQTAVSLEPTCDVLFISRGKQTLNMAWTFGVSEWWSQSFSDIFFREIKLDASWNVNFFRSWEPCQGPVGYLFLLKRGYLWNSPETYFMAGQPTPPGPRNPLLK